MYFTEMDDVDLSRLAATLSRNCELDTFAMVMICEH